MVASAKGHARVDDDHQPVRVYRKRFPGGKQEETFAHLDGGKVLTPAFIPGVTWHLDKRRDGATQAWKQFRDLIQVMGERVAECWSRGFSGKEALHCGRGCLRL